MRRVHRFLAVIAVFLGLYVASTGVGIQLIDLHTLLTHAPAGDPDLKAIQEGRDGPPNFQVRLDSDNQAQPLPMDLNLDAAFATVVKAARGAVAGAPLNFVELRMRDGKPVGQVASRGRLLRFDATSGAVLVGPAAAPKLTLPPGGGQPALRNTFKNIHRMTAYGDVGAAVFFLVALVMCAMLCTGLVLYVRLLRARVRMGRPGPFWSAGGVWRSLHRGVAGAASLFLLVVVLTGAICAFGDLAVSWYRVSHHGTRPGMTADVSSPLSDAELPGMLHTTLAAYHAAMPATPIKVVRLRYFAGMPQGVIVTGGPETLQRAYNAATGAVAPLSGPGYPVTGQPFGWQADQMIKGIHRGDAFGMTGRWLSLMTGLSLLFLCVSGAATYVQLWNQRRRAGRPGLFWP